MAFIPFPVYFSKDDEDELEKKENLGLAPETEEGIIVINTKMICSYNKMDNGNVACRMSNGDVLELPIDIEDFEDILGETEAILEMPPLSEN